MDEQELIRTMSKFICHDIASPLANVKSYVALLKSKDLSHEEKEVILNRMEEISLSGLDMIRDMRQTIKSSPFLN